MLAPVRVVEEELEHVLAQNKTAVVASTTSLATALAQRLGVPETWVGGSVRNLGIDVWLCWVRRSRFCESRAQEEEAFALQAAVTSGRAKVLVAGIAPSVMQGVGVKGFAPPHRRRSFDAAAFGFGCGLWQARSNGGSGCRVCEKAVAPNQSTDFLAILSCQTHDGIRRPLESTGARANLGHDLLDAPHRSVFHQPLHHQQAQRRVRDTPHAIANRPSFEGERSRLLPIAMQRCPQARSTEPQVERGSDRGRQDWVRESPSVRWCGAEHSRRFRRCACGVSLQGVFGRAQASRQQGTTSILCAHCANRTWTLRSTVSGSASPWRWLKHGWRDRVARKKT